MNRFYFEKLEDTDESITIKNPLLLNQLNKVLRVKVGDQIAFFNSIQNIDFIFEIKEVLKREIYLEKVGFNEIDSEIDFPLNIFNALPNKLDKIEYIIKKGVEVGVTGFYFFKSERSQKLVLSSNKIERLNKIIIEAVEQSGRWRIPELIIEDNLSLNDFKDNENIFFDTNDNDSEKLKNINIKCEKGINLFIGPEGGFSSDEIELFKKLNFKKSYLGNRILRTETVGVVTSFYIIQKYLK